MSNIGRHVYPSSLKDHAQDLETYHALIPYFEEIHVIVQSVDRMSRTERIGNIYVYQVPRITWSGTLNHLAFIGRAFFRVFSLWRQGRIDVSDASEPLAGGVVACLLRRVAGVPCLVELQGDTLEFQAGAFSPVKKLLVRLIARAVVQRADHIRAISERVAGHAAKAGINADRITVATSRLNTQRFRGRGSTGMRDVIRRKHGLVGTKVVGYLGRLHALKGLTDLVRAWPLVAAKVPEATLVIVGDGPEYQPLSSMAAEMAGTRRIVFAGGCHYDEVPAWLDAFDIFVLPSYTEGTPRALLEAMAMELAAVATSVGDIPYSVLDSLSGVVVSPGDESALASAIVELLADPMRAEAMGRRARTTVLERFAFGQSIRDLASAHYRAAGRPIPARPDEECEFSA